MTVSIDTTEFDRLQRSILDRVGIQLNENQTNDLRQIVTKLLPSFRNVDHLQLVLGHEALDSPIWQEVLQVITIGETYFFRNQDQFNALRTSVLPGIIEKHRNAGHKQIRIWSAGCASGEEIFSIAILLRELIPDFSSWSIHLLGTDINATSLERAQQGVYRNWSFRNETPEYLRDRWFVQRGESYVIDPTVQKMVTFGLLNLVSDDYPSPETETEQMDLIMFRNVSIYFDQPTTIAIIKRLQCALIENGWLVVGHAEPLASIYQGFVPQNFPNTVLYQNAAAQPESESNSTVPAPARTKITTARLEAPRASIPSASTRPPTHRTPSPAEILHHAKYAADQEDWDEANRLLSAAERANKLLPEVYYLRALIQMHTGDLDAAVSSLRRTIYCDPKFALAFYTLGEVHERRKAYKDAVHTWKLAQHAVEDMNPQDSIRFADDITVEMLLGLLAHRISQLPSSALER